MNLLLPSREILDAPFPFLERELRKAVGRFDPTSIIGTNPVTAWNHRGSDAFNLDTVVGTAANGTTLDTGVALLTGTNADDFTTPDSAANSITGNIDARFRIAPVDNTPAAQEFILGKLAGAGSRSYDFAINTNGTLLFRWSPDGTAIESTPSTSATGVADGTVYWARATVDVDNGASGYDLKYFTSTDAVNDSDDVTTWTQLGTTIVGGATTSIFDSATALTVGAASGSTNSLTGTILRGQLYTTIDGTSEVVDFNPSEADPGVAIDTDTWTSSTGEVWTVNGDAFVNNTGHTGVLSRGNWSLETSAGQTITSPVTVYAVFKPTLAAPGAGTKMFDSRSSATDRMILQTVDASADKYQIFQGGGAIIMAQAYEANLRVFTAQFNGGATTKLTISDIGSVTGDAGSVDWDFGTVMSANNGSQPVEGLFLELLVFPVAHDAGKIAFFQNYLAVKYSA